MKTFINNAINELSNDKDINKHSLIKVLVEAINNTIKMGGSISSAYNSLKRGLVDINEHLKNEKITNIIGQFDKFEETDENRLFELYKEADLNSKIENIKGCEAYSDPMVMHKISMIEDTLYKKQVPEFKCYGGFINTFKEHSYDTTIKESVEKISNYITDNSEKILVLDSIYEMNKGGGSKLYLDQIDKLTGMVLNESYSSEAIRVKLNGDLPILHRLIENLSMYESAREEKFSLGSGSDMCIIKNTIVPSIKLNESGMLFYMDDKFLSISSMDTGPDAQPKNESLLSKGSKSYVSEIEVNYVKENFEDFYSLCESFYNLKFAHNDSGNGIISDAVRNFILEFRVEEKGTIGTYLNNTKVDFDKVNFSEVLLIESTKVKNNVSNVLKGSSSIFNFEFIKLLENKQTGKETYIIEANGDYHVCEKLNKVEREWKNEIDEYKLYNYVLENFSYDISPIFKVKIDETVANIKNIENRKKEINVNVSKLEESIKKLDDNLSSGEIDDKYHGELENIKEQVENKILSLKEIYVELDLKKKEFVA